MADEARLSFLGRRVRAPFQVRWISVERSSVADPTGQADGFPLIGVEVVTGLA